MREFGKRIDLIHELAKLASREKIADNRAQRLWIDQLLRSNAVYALIVEGHSLLYEALCPSQPDPALIHKKFPDGTDATAPEMVDIVDHSVATLQLDQVLGCRNDVLHRQGPVFELDVEGQLLIDLVAPHTAEIVALGILKEPP